jgi:hypothetical protein
MLVRVSDPDRLADFILFLHNSGFPLARRMDDNVAKLHSDEEGKVQEVIDLWEAYSGTRAEIVEPD